MSEMSKIEKDMYELAKYVYELSIKHGDIYISASRSQGFGSSSVIWDVGDISNDDIGVAVYYADKKDKGYPKRSRISKAMYSLAKKTYSLSQKYGGIYVSACKCQGSRLSWTMYRLPGEDIKDVDYRPSEENKEEAV